MRSSPGWLGVSSLLVALMLVIAGCGGGDEGSDDTTAASGGDAPADSGGISADTVATANKYFGGGEGEADSSLEPLKIGFVVQKGGTPSFPEMEAAADAQVDFINKHLGGVDGHPVELVKCFMQVEEDGQKCGSELLQADVPVGLMAIGVLGNPSLYKTINGKIPLLVSVATLPQDLTSKGVYNFSGAAPTILYAKAADVAAQADGGKAAVLGVDNAGGKWATETYTAPALDSLGVDYTKPVYFPDDATTPDMVSALQAAGGADADVVLIDPSGPQNCNSLYDAMSQLGIAGTPVVATSICEAPSFVDDVTGGEPEGWRMWGFVLSPNLSDDPEVQAYEQIMEAGGQAESASVGFAPTVARDMGLLSLFANNLGADGWTADGFNKQILDYKGEAFLAPGPMNCADPILPEQPGICGREAVGAAFDGGAWVGIDPVALDPADIGQ